MKIEYCKNCFFYENYIDFCNNANNTEVPLFNRKYSRNCKRHVVYLCNKHCNLLDKIKYCFDKKTLKEALIKNG